MAVHCAAAHCVRIRSAGAVSQTLRLFEPDQPSPLPLPQTPLQAVAPALRHRHGSLRRANGPLIRASLGSPHGVPLNQTISTPEPTKVVGVSEIGLVSGVGRVIGWRRRCHGGLATCDVAPGRAWHLSRRLPSSALMPHSWLPRSWLGVTCCGHRINTNRCRLRARAAARLTNLQCSGNGVL